MKSRTSRAWVFWAAIPIILFAILLRLANVMAIPPFSDEVRHIGRVHNILQGMTFDGLDQNKWFWGYVFSFFNPTGPESGWLGRYFNTLWACISIASIIALGRQLRSASVGLLAGAIYMVIPLATFHERQALVDPMMTALTTFSMVISVAIAQSAAKGRPRWVWHTLLLGLALTAARLVKPAMLPFLVLPPVAFVLFTLIPRDDTPLLSVFGKLHRLVQPMAIWAVAAAITLGTTAIVYQVAAANGVTPRETHTITLGNTIFRDAAYEARFDKEQPPLSDDLFTIGDVLVKYVGWVALAGVALAVVYAIVTQQHWRAVAYLAVPGIVFLAVPLVANRPTGSGEIASRYLLPDASALVVLAALGAAFTADSLNRWRRGAGTAFAGLALAGILIPNLQFNLQLITDPYNANFTVYDDRVYLRHSTSGYYYRPPVEFMLSEAERTDTYRIHAVGDRTTLFWTGTFLGPRLGAVKSLIVDSEEQRYQLALWLASEDHVYLVDTGDYAELIGERVTDDWVRGPNDTILEEAFWWDTPADRIIAYRIVGGGPLLGNDIYDLYGDEPEFMSGDYDQIAGIVDASAVNQVAVYPFDHAEMLNNRTDIISEAFPLPRWPLEEEVVEEALSSMNLNDGDRFGFLTYDPPSTDPQRILATTLLDSAYPIGTEQWSGLLNYQTYAAGPSKPNMEPLGAVFEGVIHADAISILDTTVSSGEVIRIAVDWRTEAAVEDSFFTFTHVLDASGNLVAQRDGIPGGGLLPMTDWEPDETVRDRYGILLPADAAPGEYRIISGIYNPTSQLRLRVTEGSDTGDHVVLGTVTVE